jgi:hypothetical protein
MHRSDSYDSEIDEITISPSHPIIFGNLEKKGISEVYITTVQVMVTPPTPAKRERRGSLMELGVEDL